MDAPKRKTLTSADLIDALYSWHAEQISTWQLRQMVDAYIQHNPGANSSSKIPEVLSFSDGADATPKRLSVAMPEDREPTVPATPLGSSTTGMYEEMPIPGMWDFWAWYYSWDDLLQYRSSGWINFQRLAAAFCLLLAVSLFVIIQRFNAIESTRADQALLVPRADRDLAPPPVQKPTIETALDECQKLLVDAKSDEPLENDHCAKALAIIESVGQPKSVRDKALLDIARADILMEKGGGEAMEEAASLLSSCGYIEEPDLYELMLARWMMQSDRGKDLRLLESLLEQTPAYDRARYLAWIQVTDRSPDPADLGKAVDRLTLNPSPSYCDRFFIAVANLRANATPSSLAKSSAADDLLEIRQAYQSLRPSIEHSNFENYLLTKYRADICDRIVNLRTNYQDRLKKSEANKSSR